MSRPRLWLLASAVSVAFAIAALLFRPLWRDEYLAIYSAARGLPLDVLIARNIENVHPPGHFILLHFWSAIWDSDLWARAMNIPLLAGGFGLAWLAGRDRREETALYLAIAATSFWFVFFAVEARNYALLFGLIVAGVVVQRRGIEDARALSPWTAAWAALGVVVAAAHYYGALWIGLTGAAASIAMLLARRPAAFLAWGVATAVATAPTAAWLLWSATGFTTVMDYYAVATPPGELFVEGLEQFSRGLVVKTFFANLPLTIAALAGAAALMRTKDRTDAVLLAGVAGVVVIAFAAHTLVTPVIKERSFIVIIPPLLFLAARALPLAEAGRGWAARAAHWAPAAALIAPLLFAPEHFKDREDIDEVREVIAADGDDCEGAPVLSYDRPFDFAPEFTVFLTRRVLTGAADGGSPELIFVRQSPPPDAAGRTLASACAVKAVVLNLRRGEREEQAEARAALRTAGLQLETLQEIRAGDGRSLVYIAPDAPTAGETVLAQDQARSPNGRRPLWARALGAVAATME